MGLSQLFNYSVTRAPGGTASPGAGQVPQPPTVSAFLTPQSLVSFPVASTVVNLLWRGVQHFAKTSGAQQWVALLLSVIVGLFVYLASSSDPALDSNAQGWRQKAVTWFIAAVNTVCLFMAAVGESTI